MSTNNHNQGWVKLHRSLRDSPIIKDPRLLQVLIDCLLKANHKKGGYITPAGWIDIEPGQFMVGVFKQTAHLGIRKAT